jgi:phosphoglycolate phosphatase-like HAD superfamily hydrolase
MMNTTLYALDFDGVLCDSAVETGLTGWKAALKIWPDMPPEMPENILDGFREVRPIMETGYEATVIVRLLFEGRTSDTLLHDFSDSISQLLRRDELDTDELKEIFGQTRDEWVESNIDEWISMNPLFQGIADKINAIPPEQCYIITTKQERFVHKIFSQNGISVPAEQVYGLDRKQSKQAILNSLIARHKPERIIFVEDRLPTLINVINDTGLSSVQLYLALWGYNTKEDKQTASENDRINSIELSQMLSL